MNQTTNQEPELGAPGAGLPSIERFIASIRLKSRCKKDRDVAKAIFEGERQLIKDLVNQTDHSRLNQQVLIKRLRGLEDSSRYWSVLMVLEHLRMVNSLVGVTIRSLDKGAKIEFEADTAAVKPDTALEMTVFDDHEKACDLVLKCASRVDDLNTRDRFVHPWFGALTAHEWFHLAGFHMSLHRKQIELILAGC